MLRVRRGLWAAVALSLFLVVVLFWRWSSRPTVNVLVITLDTTRADRLGCFGYKPALTPALDGLARRGVLFERAYTPAPLTLPAHASMFTGLYPPEHGLLVNGMGSLPKQLPTLAGILSEAGYDTAAFVASFVLNAKFGLNRGFGTYGDDMPAGNPGRTTLERQRDGEVVVDAALAWLQQPRRRPYCCWIHLYDPHKPYRDRQAEFGQQFEKQPYDGEIAHVDRQVQRLIDFVDSRGGQDQTMIIVLGDHGEGLEDHGEREHGLTLYNNILNVPWIWTGHGISANHRVAQPVSLVDLTPTLLEMLQLRPLSRSSGRSLRPALLGQEISAGHCYSATDDTFLEHGCAPLRSLTTSRWKYVRTTEPELYDLNSDPGEQRNLAAKLPDQIAEMDSELAAVETRMRQQDATAVHLSARERQALSGLGYLGGAGDAKHLPHDAQLVDIKQRMPLINLVEDARKLHEEGQPAAAAAQFRAVLQKAPDYLLASLCLADSLSRLGQFAEAIAELEKVLDRDPDNRDARHRLGSILLAENRLDDAIQQFEMTLHDPPSADELLYVGQLLVQLGQAAKGRPYLERAVTVDPQLVEAYLSLGAIDLVEKRPRDALQHYRQALQVDSGSIEAYANLIKLLGAEGKFAEALPLAATATKLSPTNSELRFLYGTLLMALNNLSDARKEFEAACRLDPSHSLAKQYLERVRSALHDD